MNEPVRPTCLIAEDEPILRAELCRQLKTHWSELIITAQVDNGRDALDILNSEPISVAFLDIQMPPPDGVAVASMCDPSTLVVFVTAYSQFAVRAFEQSAVDFVLKPYSEQRICGTVARVKQRLEDTTRRAIDFSLLVDRLQPSTSKFRWIPVGNRGGSTKIVHVDDVLYFKSEDKYTKVALADSSHYIRTALNTLESRLDSNNFQRIHRSAIVNLHFVKEIRRDAITGRLRVSLESSDDDLSVSKRYAGLFRPE